MPLIELRDVSAGYYPGYPVISGLSLKVEEGEFVGVIGPNGSGKTTLVRVMAGAFPPASGQVLIGGRPVGEWSRVKLARLLAVVPQMSAPPFAFTVRELVDMGRTPYVAPWAPLGAADAKAVDSALAIAGLTDLAKRPVTELSGGEFQLAALARALAQEPKVLILDEPTTFLDPAHTVHTLSVLEDENERGLTLVAILHDLNMAAAYCRRIVAVKEGKVFADGPAREVLSAQVLEELYETPILVEAGADGRPRVTLVKVKAPDVA
jgi:iron complex transport system ATP-binding protein